MREKPQGPQPSEDSSEITTEELREFLEGDLTGATIDPRFKEELRRTLWDFIQSRNDRVGGDGS